VRAGLMDWCVGTSGYSYPAWKGVFYPEDLPSARMLGYYAGRLKAVEINNTFYRLPKQEVVRSWGEQVPPDFRFVIKASRRITHFARLGPEAADPTDYLLRNVAELGEKLGAVLFQLPPNLKVDLGRLEAFLGLLPADIPAAFEFRHPSWHDEAVHRLLEGRDAALVCADTDDAPDDEAIVSTASWGYLRLRRASYGASDLADWATRIAAQKWQRAFVFFKHEDEGAGPRMAEEFLTLALNRP
jgi:uncharacterized protein YecE (DUF72 family)